MSYSTNVPAPSFTPVGFVAPTEQAILTGVQADYAAAFGANLNPALNTPQGQLETSTTAIIAQADASFVFLSNQMDPAYNFGRWQDAIARIYFLTRDPAEPTVLQVACGGLAGVVIPAAQALVQDPGGNLYACTEQGTIGLGGSVTLTFAAQIPGPTAVPESLSIYQSVANWNTATPVSGVVGQDVETRAAFEARREATVAANGQGFLDAIAGAVWKLSGVLDVLALENPTGSPEVIQGVTLAAHSLYVAVVGGEAADIAQTIWTKKDPGCNYNGNTTIDVQDTNPGYSEPYPTYPVTFEIPPGVSTTFNVTLFNNPQVPSNVVTLVQNAVMAAFTGADGGSRAGIGATIFASRYYGGVAALGSWANIISLGVGTAATADAAFTASVSGTTLDVTAISTGTLLVGADVFNTGTVAIAPGSFIVSQLTGSAGSTGTYQLAAATTTVASEGMISVSPVQNVVTLNANQVPTLQLADVNVTLSGTV